jgi:hypothetical protein
VALANKNARVLWALLARNEDYRVATAPESGAPQKNLPKGVAKVVCKLIANRSDRHLSNLSNCQGAKPVRLIRRRCADFHHGPERNAALQQQAGYMTAIAHQTIRAATLRTGLGPYMTVRIRVLIAADSLLESLNSARQRHPTGHAGQHARIVDRAAATATEARPCRLGNRPCFRPTRMS